MRAITPQMVDYAEAERAFEWCRRVDPARLEGLDIYSTVLWHLKKEVDLSYLAQEMVALNRLAPQTWLVSAERSGAELIRGVANVNRNGAPARNGDEQYSVTPLVRTPPL